MKPCFLVPFGTCFYGFSIKMEVLKIEISERGSEGFPFFTETAVMLLLHGFPSARHMFRDLMSMQEDRFHLMLPYQKVWSQDVSWVLNFLLGKGHFSLQHFLFIDATKFELAVSLQTSNEPFHTGRRYLWDFEE